MNATTLRFDRMPSLAGYLPRAMIARRPPRLAAGETVPLIEARVDRVRPVPDRVARFSRVCAFAGHASLPITYPHVMAAPLHMAMLTSKAFPVKLLGLIHVSNRIAQHIAIPVDASLGFDCVIEGHRDTKRGQEFDLQTTAQLDGAIAWEETTRFLARTPRKGRTGQARSRASNSSSPPATGTKKIDVPADTGRRYAAVSGDYNPIHLSAVSARVFGFRRAIAHGMWTLARCAAELIETDVRNTVTLDVEFKLPVLMPARVSLSAQPDGNGIAFALKDADDQRPHLNGTVTGLS